MKREDLILETLDAVEGLSLIMHEYDSMQHVYAGYRLYQTEAHMIEQIGDNPGVNVSQLARVFSKTVSACSQIIKKLLQKKLITKCFMPENARIHKLYHTREGRRVYEDHNWLEKHCFERDLEKFHDISVEEIETFLKISGILHKCFQRDLTEQKKRLQRYNDILTKV